MQIDCSQNGVNLALTSWMVRPCIRDKFIRLEGNLAKLISTVYVLGSRLCVDWDAPRKYFNK